MVERNDDQFFLQVVLLELGFKKRWGAVHSDATSFRYEEGTVVKHFLRSGKSKRKWKGASVVEQRLARIQEVTEEEICNQDEEELEEEEELDQRQRQQPAMAKTSTPSRLRASTSHSPTALETIMMKTETQRKLAPQVPCRLDWEPIFEDRRHHEAS